MAKWLNGSIAKWLNCCGEEDHYFFSGEALRSKKVQLFCITGNLTKKVVPTFSSETKSMVPPKLLT